MEYRSDGVREYSWEGSPTDPVFSRYTRYSATIRVNIEDCGDLSRYIEPLQPLHGQF